jgi:purine catabolism regulator
MLQLRLAPAYWPSLAFCRRGDLSPDTLQRVALSWQEQAPPGSFAVTWEGASILLYADEREGTVARADVERAVGQMVRLVGIQCPGGDAHAIVGELSVPVERVQAHVLLLRKLRRYATRGVQDPPLVNVRSFALDRLLEHVDAPSRRSFVRQCVGPLIAHDERHGSTLAETLELALEHPRRDDAARAAYMHRNTFRRRLQQALDLVGADLDDPDQRLTLHVALKLHRVSSASGPAARN